MDQATQQNAALVEESAAAAESLKEQAQQLVQAVAVFKLSVGEVRATPHAAIPVTPPKASPVATKKPAAAVAAAKPPAVKLAAGQAGCRGGRTASRTGAGVDGTRRRLAELLSPVLCAGLRGRCAASRSRGTAPRRASCAGSPRRWCRRCRA